ncbi:glycerate kinase type-2 family protein [Rhodohalobacter halophilus]|uniref:glycerate kinase type-2 family protein n=1 Tax=Rhodohalobacter halophilus TaxID=1812810 RepID=UPI00083F568E|nr:DUF4147 domain-containing protein [Rhodohalobacter halophilus]
MYFSQSDAVELFKDCLRKIHPCECIPSKIKFNRASNSLIINDDTVDLNRSNGIYLIGMGKASVPMAEALSSILDEKLTSGMIISPEKSGIADDKIHILHSSHPIPDQSSVDAAEQLIRFVRSIPKGATLFNLISGGTSSLFCKPADGISVDDYAIMVEQLLKSGASINEINLVRKSVSAVKAGRFLEHLHHTILIDLIISDVPDNNPENIGSGPTTAQSFSYREVFNILDRYNLKKDLPDSVISHLQRHSDEIFKSKEIDHHRTYTLISAKEAAEVAAAIIQKRGFEVIVDDTPWAGPIDRFVQHIITKAESLLPDTAPVALIFYGECTVQVSGTGKGGRNQELALRMADKLSDCDRDLIFLSGGTDGVDGPTDAAGAVVNQNTKRVAKSMNADLNSYLMNNDSYHFFEKVGGHIKTGPTGNNVMDLQLLFIL